MMSSYFDFFCKNIESEDAQNTDRITGTCYSMCPEEEVKLYVYILIKLLGHSHVPNKYVPKDRATSDFKGQLTPLFSSKVADFAAQIRDLAAKYITSYINAKVTLQSKHLKRSHLELVKREVERLVHVLEVWGSERKLVKSYSRSAADSNMAVPHLLRPNSVLTNTVQYLLMDITRRVDVPASVVYDYVNDRLRAVRQDATIQRLPPEQHARLLEPMIRFYVYYGYKLSNLPLKDYDPVLNKKYLLECIKWYLSCCDTIAKTCGKIDHLTGFLSNLDLNGKDKKNKLANDKVLMESLYILCNLDDLHPLFRYVNLSKEFKRHPNLQLAYEIAIANFQGNYIRVCRLSEKLCPLSYCALCTYLPTLQRRALHVMSHAYNNKRLTVPGATLAQWLHFRTERDAASACAHYGLKVEGAGVRFDKTEFKADAALNTPKPQDIREKFDLSIMDIFTYTTPK